MTQNIVLERNRVLNALIEKFDEVLGENSEVIGNIEGQMAVDEVMSMSRFPNSEM